MCRFYSIAHKVSSFVQFSNNKYSLLMHRIKIKSPTIFFERIKGFRGWIYLVSISSYSGGITMIKSLPDIGGTTMQNVGPLAPMEPGVHTRSL